jgi:hypothetical protein
MGSAIEKGIERAWKVGEEETVEDKQNSQVKN